MKKLLIWSLHLLACAVMCNALFEIKSNLLGINFGFKPFEILNTIKSIFGDNSKSDSNPLFIQDCLDAHNSYRARHGAELLTLDNDLSNYAQQWAEHLGKSRVVGYRENPKYGENLFSIPGAKVNGVSVVMAWYDGVEDYNFDKPEYSEATAEFAQIVWKNSKKLGVGLYYNGVNTVVVCNYDPPGLIPGEFEANVARRIY